MTIVLETDARFRALPLKLAAFGLTALAGALAVILLFAWRQGYFEPKTPLVFVSDSGTDLRLGMAVKFSGFTIGEVSSLVLDDKGRVRIGVQIENRYLRWIRPDSVGRVGKDGLIGDGYIDVGLGDLKRPQVQANAELEFIPARSMDDILREVHDRAMPVIREVEGEMRRLNDPQGDLNQTIANLRSFTAGLNDTRERLNSALDNVNRLSGKEVPAVLASTRQTLEHADAALQTVSGRLPGLLDKTDQTLGNLQQSSKYAHELLQQLGPDSVELVRDGRDLLRKGNDSVDAVNGSWPMNRLLAPTPAMPARSDSQGVR
ncbi:MlaD family protein [Chitinimonas sp.]|uniref:MlaD family protein n=1 Tax=Chitinimonas sp. TaxID=1934313 RepID=UPI0035ADF80F